MATAGATAPLEIEAVLDLVLSSACRLLQGEGGSIMLLVGPEELEVVASPGNPAALGARVKFGEGVAGKVAQSCDGALVSGRAGKRAKPIDSGMSVPLMHQGGIFGVLNINGGPGRHFSDFDLQSATRFAAHAADALAAARRYEMARREGEKHPEKHLGEMLRHLNAGAGGEFEPPDEVEPVNLGALVRVVADECEREGRPVEVRGPLHVAVMARGASLRRAVREVVDNAHLHGEAPVRLVLQEGDPVTLRIVDAGSGIPPEDREHVFDPYVRLDGAAELPGLGLGLTIARRVIEGVDGMIDAGETPVGGGLIRIRLRAG